MSLTEKETDVIVEGFEKASSGFEKIKNEQTELKNNLAQLQKSIQAYRKMGLSGQTEPGQEHTHFWQTESDAKAFGELIWQALGRKTMGEAIGSGGVLVPTEMATWIIQKLGQYGTFRRNVTTFPMGSSSMLVPKIETDLTVQSR